MILRLLTLGLACASLLAVTACDHTDDAPQPPVGFHPVGPRNRPVNQEVVDNRTTSLPPDTLPPEPTPPPRRVTTITENGGSTVPNSAPSGDPSYGIPVKDKPGYVTSPYAPDSGYIDVRDFAPGQEARDPYTHKVFLVP